MAFEVLVTLYSLSPLLLDLSAAKKIREREKEILHRNHHKVAIEHSIIEVTVLKKQFPAFHFTFCLFHNIFLILIVILVQQLLNGS